MDTHTYTPKDSPLSVISTNGWEPVSKWWGVAPIILARWWQQANIHHTVHHTPLLYGGSKEAAWKKEFHHIGGKGVVDQPLIFPRTCSNARVGVMTLMKVFAGRLMVVRMWNIWVKHYVLRQALQPTWSIELYFMLLWKNKSAGSFEWRLCTGAWFLKVSLQVPTFPLGCLVQNYFFSWDQITYRLRSSFVPVQLRQGLPVMCSDDSLNQEPRAHHPIMLL